MSDHDYQLERAAHEAALESVRMLWDSPVGALNGRATLESLSKTELTWIVSHAIAQWIVARSKQVTQSRMGVEGLIRTLKMHGEPEPWEAGAVTAVLPVLGDLVVEMGTVDLPISEWPKDKIIAFAWACFIGVDAARTNRDEMPTEIPFDHEPSTLMAG